MYRSAPTAPSGRKWEGSQLSGGTTELAFPRAAFGKMQSEAAHRAGEPPGHGEEAPPEGRGGYDLLAQTDAHSPAGELWAITSTASQAPLATKRPEIMMLTVLIARDTVNPIEDS